jgi:hypothetical protein
MRRFWLFLFAGLAVHPVACQIVESTVQNAINEPVTDFDLYRFHRRTRALATQAWESFAIANAHCVSPDYRDGFIDGYADYLEFGGNGEPIAEPPKRYQRIGYQTPSGIRAVAEYYDGFTQGIGAAKASGQRELLVIPVLHKETAPISTSVPSAIPSVHPSGELLPMPKAEPDKPSAS